MLLIDIPNGEDQVDFDSETAASRVGNRIRKIRIEKGLSQIELAEKTGLTADRISKYENGARLPKNDMIKKLASALEVSTAAITDPNTTDYVGAMYALFELENCFNMRIDKISKDYSDGLALTIRPDDHFYDYMIEWYKIYESTQVELEGASSEEERNDILKTYHNWEWNFPQGIVDRTTEKIQRSRIENKIKELQGILDKMNEKKV